MSVKTQVTVSCDTHDGGFATSGPTEEAARAVSRFHPWHRRGNRDICGHCWEEGKR